MPPTGIFCDVPLSTGFSRDLENSSLSLEWVLASGVPATHSVVFPLPLDTIFLQELWSHLPVPETAYVALTFQRSNVSSGNRKTKFLEAALEIIEALNKFINLNGLDTRAY
ncbi:hypothetical protein DFH08DRAFT_824736 [Mycena albidolilacea]|uniref:Uncharacterized protein n=1 Tax=Mycena albidolilacea TaxID=1033008 RepID=A0AAD6Z3C3_9AGAR|nr:hypothetical protein DFH08DRAFT_824736 [Mycena albidolilacea]